MSAISTVIKAKLKKQPVMVVTFDDVYGFPSVLCDRVNNDKFNDAALFLMGKSHEGKRVLKPSKSRSKKKENVIHKFFRILFTKETAPKKAVYQPIPMLNEHVSL